MQVNRRAEGGHLSERDGDHEADDHPDITVIPFLKCCSDRMPAPSSPDVRICTPSSSGAT
jgi:hypothetical protein